MKLSRSLPRLGLLAAGLLAACTTQDIVASYFCPTSTSPGSCEVTKGGYCRGHGPPAELQNGAGTTNCGNGTLLTSRYFQTALCMCQDYLNTGAFTIDSLAPAAPSSMGVNGSLSTRAALQIGGGLTVAGASGISTEAELSVQGTLRDSGPLGLATGRVTVGGDAQVGQDINLAALRVDGTLTRSMSAMFNLGQNNVAKEMFGSVSVAAPCDCAAADTLNVAQLVSAYSQDDNNDNASISLAPGRLDGISSDEEIALPCGRYFLSGISSTGNVTLRPEGRVALFVAREISLTQNFRIELAPGSELDLFLDGRFDVSGAPQLGAKDAPSRLRIYVANALSINLPTAGFIAGNLYAPTATVAMSDSIEFFGSLFVASLSATLPIKLHYDSQSANLTSSCL